jgi:hypothetical protein
MEINKWEQVKNFVNNSTNIFTKKEMKNTIDVGYTGELYVALMMNAGFIKRIARSKYQKIINVPNYMTSTFLQSIAYSDHKKKKIMTALSRRQKLENINEIKTIT